MSRRFIVLVAVVGTLLALAFGALGAGFTPTSPARSAPAADPFIRVNAQGPAWGPCPLSAGGDPRVECADVRVPLDHARPDGATIRIKVSRLRASDPDRRIGVLLLNPGGPGGSGLWLPAALAEYAPQLHERFDLIGFDPRFVGESTPITCGLEPAEQNWPRYSGRDGFAADARAAEEFAAKCQRVSGDLFPHLNTEYAARDMDVIRSALGEQRISYLGWSYGTNLGAVYAQLFPERADRFVLDSVVHPGWVWREQLRRSGRGFEAALNQWATWTARSEDRYGLGSTAAAVRKTYDALVAELERDPVETDAGPVDGDLLRAWTLVQLYSDRTYPLVAGLVAELRSGTVDPDHAAELADLGTGDGAADDNRTAAYWGVLCEDVVWPRDLLRYAQEAKWDAIRYPFFGAEASNITPCAFWPDNRIRRPVPITGNRTPGVLLVQAAGDPVTPFEGTLAMRRRLATNVRLVTLVDAYAHQVFAAYGNPCVDRAVTEYLLTGRLPHTDVTCANLGEQLWRAGPPNGLGDRLREINGTAR
ncbi:alpha/beta hydrolase [Carbonactinospora thermoautotrophica]|uniref:alpha/beta hydrolase n=1 Tax=Carbonactinospora thermoautotrophica TaxID=1469144 RepID=UPI00226F2425|nr:alpha/beta hydrolase [Carbonactinospora thermoautotrophica]MCX9189982.1 alpha/beta hydrolase [Carbonactinospora thermoautotrophica]